MLVYMSYSPFADKPTLTGTVVELRPFDRAATEAMVNIYKEKEVLFKTGAVSSSRATNKYSDDQVRAFYGRRNEKRKRLDLAVYSLELDQYVGEAVLNHYSPENKSAHYRIALGAAGRGRGLGTEATRLMVDYGFEELGLNRIELEVFEFNAIARHVYTSCGFVLEGRRREAFFYDGKYYDALIKSVIRSDWEAVRAMSAQLEFPDPVVKI